MLTIASWAPQPFGVGAARMLHDMPISDLGFGKSVSPDQAALREILEHPTLEVLTVHVQSLPCPDRASEALRPGGGQRLAEVYLFDAEEVTPGQLAALFLVRQNLHKVVVGCPGGSAMQNFDGAEGVQLERVLALHDVKDEIPAPAVRRLCLIFGQVSVTTASVSVASPLREMCAADFDDIVAVEEVAGGEYRFVFMRTC